MYETVHDRVILMLGLNEWNFLTLTCVWESEFFMLKNQPKYRFGYFIPTKLMIYCWPWRRNFIYAGTALKVYGLLFRFEYDSVNWTTLQAIRNKDLGVIWVRWTKITVKAKTLIRIITEKLILTFWRRYIKGWSI